MSVVRIEDTVCFEKDLRIQVLHATDMLHMLATVRGLYLGRPVVARVSGGQEQGQNKNQNNLCIDIKNYGMELR